MLTPQNAYSRVIVCKKSSTYPGAAFVAFHAGATYILTLVSGVRSCLLSAERIHSSLSARDIDAETPRSICAKRRAGGDP
jgi:hypothetical protein